MTLSEAIRLGAMLKPQYHGHMRGIVRTQTRVPGWRGSVLKRTMTTMGIGTCALGAALDAIGESNARFMSVASMWPWTWTTLVRNPVTGERREVLNTIWRLNDVHDWSRERIADWVEQIEAQHAPQPEVGQQNLTEALR